MITNLVASIVVTLVTNVSERFPTVKSYEPCFHAFNCGMQYHIKEIRNPDSTKRWVTTEVKQLAVLAFDWEGERCTHEREKIVSSITVEYTLKAEWEPGRTTTNTVVYWTTNSPIYFSTNATPMPLKPK